MKILNLIQYSPGQYYQEMREIQRRFLKTFGANISCYFYCYDNTIEEPFKIDGDMLYLKGTEGWDTMSPKTYDVLATCLKQLDFDILVRTNISTLCKVQEVVDCFSATEKLFGGNVWKEANFMSGICMVLTRDTVQMVVENKHLLQFWQPEDVMISYFFNEMGVPMTPINEHFGWNIDHNDEKIYVFRNKRSDRNQDLEIMRQIVDEIMLAKK